jgi:hypothetical protein
MNLPRLFNLKLPDNPTARNQTHVAKRTKISAGTDNTDHSSASDRMSGATAENGMSMETEGTMRSFPSRNTGYSSGNYVTRLGTAEEEALIQSAIAKARGKQRPWYKRIFSRARNIV